MQHTQDAVMCASVELHENHVRIRSGEQNMNMYHASAMKYMRQARHSQSIITPWQQYFLCLHCVYSLMQHQYGNIYLFSSKYLTWRTTCTVCLQTT